MASVLYVLLSELIVLPLLIGAQEHPLNVEASRDQQDELEAFLHMSALEVGHRYFERPPYRLFAIRRLIELDDSAAVPVLQRAFADETEVRRRRFIAAALVSLGD